VEHARYIGDLPGIWCDKKGTEVTRARMKDVTYCPTSAFNLFSASKRAIQGWSVQGNKDAFWVEKDGVKIVFDIRIDTQKGAVFCGYFKRNMPIGIDGAHTRTDYNVAMMSINQLMSVNQAHSKLGHLSETMTRQAVQALNWKLKPGTMHPCEDCAIGKARQKNVPKNLDEDPEEKVQAGRFFLDIASIKERDDLPTPTYKHWRVIVDDRTGYKSSDFYHYKNDMVQPTCQLFHKWKGLDIDVTKV
jgi:hypothetical protein